MNHNDFGISKEQFEKEKVFAQKINEAEGLEFHIALSSIVQFFTALLALYCVFWNKEAVLSSVLFLYSILFVKVMFLSSAKSLWKEIFYYCANESLRKKKEENQK